MKKLATMIAALAIGGTVHAAPVPAAKQELVNRVLQLWHPESIGESMLQAPVGDAVQQARAVLQGRVSPEKRDAALKEIVADARQFMDQNKPLAQASAQKLVGTTVAPLLAERFTDDELRQIITILESPVKKKFEAMVPELQKKLGEGVAADTRAVMDPKLQELQQRIGMRLRSAVTP
ncbi:hypothetical protein [Duganella sp. Root1480D1]|uniref:hypothetical protein n=1 Tax=Duganella sp. Root1480D1 TaxID=1736471 RepID=UPI00070DD76A|nr:hypothetical protein [Duganella sp. Root1480D1]KQZ39593.1 hypothetical protein ASD58_04140 [Duganella sp. Root1480D1]